MPIIEGSGLGAPLQSPGPPVGGTDEIQTITIGGTPTGGTFRLGFQGFTTADVAWSATGATLAQNVHDALDALPGVASNAVSADGSALVAGIGAMTVRFQNSLGKRDVTQMTIANNSLTGTAPTLAVTTTTPGVWPTGYGAPLGALLVDTGSGVLYINGNGTPPIWTVVGTQT